MQTPLSVALSACLVLGTAAAPGLAGEEVDLDRIRPAVVQPDNTLYLEVFINGQPKNKIAEFKQNNAKNLISRASELRDIGLAFDKDIDPDKWIELKTLPGAQYRYQPQSQQIYINVTDEGLALSVYSASGKSDMVQTLDAGKGFYVNYDLYAALSSGTSDPQVDFSGASAVLEAWAYHPFGSLFNSAVVNIGEGGQEKSIHRLDSFFTRYDRKRQTNLRIGDLISGGLSWSRPIRMGGIQYRRSFETRPDLIRQPLPSFSGTAAVPSTVDVFLGNVKLSSTQVDPGRFALTNIPTHTPNGDLRVVVQGITGAEIEYILPFNTTPNLLRQGLFDFSLEAGFARRGYASDNDNYDLSPLAQATLRYGLNDRVTLESHGEVSTKLINGGVGALTSLGQMGTIHAAISASHYSGLSGGQISAGYNFSRGRFNFGIETRRKFGDYLDLADVTTDETFSTSNNSQSAISYDSAIASFSTEYGGWSGALGYVHTQTKDRDHDHFGTLSIGKSLTRKIQFHSYARTDIQDVSDFRIFAGLSFQLGDNASGFAGVTTLRDDYLATTSYSRSTGSYNDRTGYHVALRGNHDEQALSGSITRRLSKADLQGRAHIDSHQARISGHLRGAVSLQSGKLRLARRIEDSFIIVNAGAPGVTVLHENRKVGKTDDSGRLLISGIRSYEANRVALNPDDLPLYSPISRVKRTVIAPPHNGVEIDFVGDRAKQIQVSLNLTDAAGKPILPGAIARIDERDDEHVIGYDGQLFIATQKTRFDISVHQENGKCTSHINLGRKKAKFFDLGETRCNRVPD